MNFYVLFLKVVHKPQEKNHSAKTGASKRVFFLQNCTHTERESEKDIVHVFVLRGQSATW